MELEKKEDISFDPKIDTVDVKKKSDNIFSELSWELDFWHEQEVFVAQKKDKVYYLKLWSSLMSITNIFLFVFTLIWTWFFLVQNNNSFYSKPFLDPFCQILLSDDIKNTWDYCSSVASLLSDYNKKTIDLKNEITDKLSLIINDTYIIENFINSKEVTFLIDNKNNRLKVLNILNDFDNLKNDFSGLDKKMMDCVNIKITNDSLLEATCNVNSSSWELSNWEWKWIIWYTWDRNSSLIEGTSITIAASFLNFIQKNPRYNFQLIEKQKDFASQSIVWEWSYVKKTSINLKLKYNNLKSSLSL